MPNQKLTELTRLTSLPSGALVYVVPDPDGSPLSRAAEVDLFVTGGSSGSYGPNIIKNSPGQIVIDATIPQWWLETGNATSTLEDAVGEGIPDLTEWVLKVVTISDDHHCYQVHTFADENLLDAGQTVVSFGCWVYATAANLASIAISGTNLGLQESSQHTGDSTWQWLTVNNITLDAADTAIQTRCIVDTGTAYFTMPSLTVGSIARPWMPRGMIWVWSQDTAYDLNTTGDVAWSDFDISAWVGSLAVMVQARVFILEANGTLGSAHSVTSSDDLTASDSATVQSTNLSFTVSHTTLGIVSCNDSQLIRYTVAEVDADSDVRAILNIQGSWRWE